MPLNDLKTDLPVGSLLNLLTQEGVAKVVVTDADTASVAAATAAIVMPSGSFDFFGQLIGYSAEMLAGPNYDGPPLWSLAMDPISDTLNFLHNLAIVNDGQTVIFSASEGGSVPNNALESYFVIALDKLVALALATGGAAIPPIQWWTNGQFVNQPAPNQGARNVLELANGTLAFQRANVMTITRSQLGGVADWRQAPTPGVYNVAWDLTLAPNQLMWGGAGNVIYGVPTPAFGAATKVMSGSNISGNAADDGITAVCADVAGNLWAVDRFTGLLKFWTAAQLAALTAVATNPAPTRTLDTGLGSLSLWGMTLDVNGGAWVSEFFAGSPQPPGLCRYYTVDQLAAGGAQSPSNTLLVPQPNTYVMRLMPGYGLFAGS